MRPDGVFVIDARSTFEIQDGALLYVAYSGLIDAGRDGYERLQRGEIATDGTPFRTTPRFQTGHPEGQPIAADWANLPTDARPADLPAGVVGVEPKALRHRPDWLAQR